MYSLLRRFRNYICDLWSQTRYSGKPRYTTSERRTRFFVCAQVTLRWRKRTKNGGAAARRAVAFTGAHPRRVRFWRPKVDSMRCSLRRENFSRTCHSYSTACRIMQIWHEQSDSVSTELWRELRLSRLQKLWLVVVPARVNVGMCSKDKRNRIWGQSFKGTCHNLRTRRGMTRAQSCAFLRPFHAKRSMHTYHKMCI